MAKKPTLKELLGNRIEVLKRDNCGVADANWLGDEFIQLMADRREAANGIAELEELKDELTTKIATHLVTHGYLGCFSDYGTASILASSRGTISKTKLLENGVTPETIEACTERSETYMLRVDKGK